MADPVETAPRHDQRPNEEINPQLWQRAVHAFETMDSWIGHVPRWLPVVPRYLEALSSGWKAMGTGLLRRDLDDPDSGRLSAGETVGRMTRLYGESIANLGLAAIEVAGIYFLLREGRRLRGGIPTGERAPAEPGPPDGGPPSDEAIPFPLNGRPPVEEEGAEPAVAPEDAGGMPALPEPEAEAADTGEPQTQANAAGSEAPGAASRIFGGLSEKGKQLWRWIDDDLLGETDENAIRTLRAVLAAGEQLTQGLLGKDSRVKVPAALVFRLGDILIERKHPPQQKDIFDQAAARLKQTWSALSDEEKLTEIARIVAEAEEIDRRKKGRPRP